MIEGEFEEALWASCRESRTLGYKPVAFEKMLGGEGGVETAHRLLASFVYQDGFRRLWELRRLDLSLVRLASTRAVQEQFEAIFHLQPECEHQVRSRSLVRLGSRARLAARAVQ